MARKLRIQFGGAIYHVINRGNYRRDVFERPEEGRAFLATLKEAKEMMGWRVHAYVLMRNHYHFAVETPEPNLVQGMHWLQSTWATRFNRFRRERGHLFQGRYQALLVQDAAVLGRVVDYIHLNPVRAKIVEAEQVRNYRWSSLGEILKGEGWVDDLGWRAGGRFGTEPDARQAYEAYLVEVGREEARWEQLGLKGLSRGWAIGTTGWRRALAKEYGQLALNPGLEREEVSELREGAWEATFERVLQRSNRQEAELAEGPARTGWKLALAEQVRQESGASLEWLARRLGMVQAGTLRSYLHKRRGMENLQNTA
jgi:REP element-mobilizing transposase RayT